MCECGEKVDSAAHTLENDVCTVCGTEIVTYEDEMIQLTAYNEYATAPSMSAMMPTAV